MLGIFNFTIGIIFIICAVVFIEIARRNFQEKGRESSWTVLLASGTTFVMGIYFIVWGVIGLVNQGDLLVFAEKLPIPYPLGFYSLCFIPAIYLFIGLFVIREKRKEKSQTAAKPPEKSQEIHPIDLEVSRKAFHITIIGILTCYLFVGKLAADALYAYLKNEWDIWHIQDEIIISAELAGKSFALFMIVAIFFLLILTDFVRIFAPRYYPVKMISNVYRDKERGTLGPHVLLAVGVTFAVLLFAPPIAMGVIAMSALGDASATIVGVTVGKHKIRGGKSKKTWEGCIAGVAVSFTTGFLCMILLVNYKGDPPIPIALAVQASLVLCGVGTLIFFVIDYFTPTIPLTDNILNPVCIGLAMTGLAYFFFPFLL
ncbi:MAG: hypothetical protein HWN66_11925 [Candidatus Helarchaeota archaeon]|nr:hypothetical protein [Candidatus Helarchaeota archaeon]